MTKITNIMILLIVMFLNIQSVAFADGSITASTGETTLVVYKETTGTISITTPDKPEDTNEVRYVGNVTAGTPTVSGLYTPFPTAQNPEPESTNESGVTAVSSSAFTFKGTKSGTWKETFTVSFSVATEVYDSETDLWETGDTYWFPDDAQTSITFTVIVPTLSVSVQQEYIPLKNTFNPDRYNVTVTASPAPVAGTITLTASNKLNLYHSATGGEPSNALSWTATSDSYTGYMEGKSASQSVRDQTLTAAYSVAGTEPAEQKVTVCSVSITVSRWTALGKRSNVSLFYAPPDLDVGDIVLEGSAVGLFDFYETVKNETTGEDEEQPAAMSWSLPREASGIALLAEGKEIGNGKLTVRHTTSGAKDENNAGVTEITLKVEEKPWGLGWLDPEDSNEDWYVLWNCDQHRFVAEVADSILDDIQSVTTTVTMNTGNQIVSEPIDVSLHSVNIQWQSAQQFTDEPSSSFGTLHLARLHTPGGKWTAFQVPTSFTPYYNQIRVRIDISPEIPQGRKGTLHLEMV